VTEEAILRMRKDKPGYHPASKPNAEHRLAVALLIYPLPPRANLYNRLEWNSKKPCCEKSVKRFTVSA
jgi:hypothetical protein